MKWTNFLTNSGFRPRGLMLLQHISVIVFTSLFLFCGVGKAQGEQDDTQTVEVCDAKILTGGYGYSFSGFSGPYAGTPFFFLKVGSLDAVSRVGAVGLLTFDGAGGLIARDTLARSGIKAIRHAGAGMYSVNANCTGHASIDLTSDTPIDLEHLEFDFMIVPGGHGREFSFIVTNQGITDQASCSAAVPDCTPKPTQPVQTGVALSTGDEACSDASLQGTYGLVSTGTNLTNPLAPFSNANVGFRVLDGAGQTTDGTDTALQNGAIVPATDRRGTYSVQRDCTGTAARNLAGGGNTFDLVVVAGGRQAYLLRTQNLAVTNVFLKKGSGRFVTPSSDTTPHSDSSVDDDGGND